MEHNYYAHIPAPVLLCKELEPNAKILVAHIAALSRQQGFCWASNKYLADLFDVDTRTVQRWIEALRDKGFIQVDLERQGIRTTRKLWIRGPKEIHTERQKCHPQHGKNATHSTAEMSSNNNRPITTEDKRATSVALVPTREARTGPPPLKRLPPIFYDFEKREFSGIEPLDLVQWKEAYPEVNIPQQIKECGVWCGNNGKKINKRTNGLRSTITAWLGKAQNTLVDKAARLASYQASSFKALPRGSHFGVNDALGNPDAGGMVVRGGAWVEETSTKKSGS